MYFFDFADYCYLRVIGSNSQNMFNTPVGSVCGDLATTYRQTKDALLKSVGQWYDMSNELTYQYDPSVNLSWPSDLLDYNTYTGGFTSFDDGYSNVAIPLPTTFKMNNVSSSDLYVSTNGYFTIGSGRGTVETSPIVGPPATLCGNPGDNWLQPGLENDDLDYQNVHYQTGNDGSGRFYVKLLVFGGQYGSNSQPFLRKIPTSWVANFYRDTQYQWLETRAKSNIRGNAGPYNASSVAQSSSTTSKVWRGDLNGQNWVYMGTGSVTTTRTCPECDTYYTQFTATTASITAFWVDADNNFVNTTQADFTTYVQNMYHQQCLLKQLLKCVDGDTFPTFTNLTFPGFE